MVRSAEHEAMQYAVSLTPLLSRPSYVNREFFILLHSCPVVTGNVCDLVTSDLTLLLSVLVTWSVGDVINKSTKMQCGSCLFGPLHNLSRHATASANRPVRLLREANIRIRAIMFASPSYRIILEVSVHWLRTLVAGLSPRRTSFDHQTSLYEVWSGQSDTWTDVIPKILGSHRQYHSTHVPYLSSCTCRPARRQR